MLDQLKSRHGAPKTARPLVFRFHHSGGAGMSNYFKVSIVIVAALLALVV